MKKVDARGLVCPLPVVNTKKALDEINGETQIEILVDNEIAVQNVTKFANGKNLNVFSEKAGEKEYRILITLSEDTYDHGPEKQNNEEISCYPDGRRENLVVILSSNKMGEGEDELGKTLMKAFIFALTKQDILPKTILLYNSGAFLSCEGSDSLEDLKSLEAEGVEIFTCGTCLNYYELTKKLSVGSVSNMYDIVEMMESADKIIKP
ncbi:response regulator SirA [Anaerostipes sp. 494a]|uniref:sulfurtransferase-like selenium metabolism protein YedF n=1 Tax=Anaerostipes sp. 494a TaxID=1261636 RepID=UPI00095176FB|nr:sulfurtransferase-like selenium metabolism protein YedF [Anaerostipes sp. 494a]OLR58487.1 response regulator SirA [Anaerostipes sp. 494a]